MSATETLSPRAVLVLVTMAACGADPPTSPPGPPGPMLRCPGDREAALPDGAGGVLCLAVGARGYGGTAPWAPGVDASVARHVRPGAPPGGDGSRATPFATLAEALSGAPPGATIAIAEGRLTLDAGARVAVPVTIVGAGPDRTTLALPASDTALAWTAAGGALRGVKLWRGGARTADDAAVAVDVGDGAALALEDVVIEGAGVALRVGDGALTGNRVDVLSSGRNGVLLRRGARASLASFVVRGGAGAGVGADEAHVHLRDGLIDHNAAHGLALVRAPAARGGRETCDGAVDLAGEGPRDCVSRVSIQCNGIAGVYVDGARVVDLRSVAVLGTRPNKAILGGDGIYAQGGARVLLDADRPEGAAAGGGSLVGDNARVGLLLDGSGTTLVSRGLRAWENANGGVFLQAAALGEELIGGDLRGNGGVGVAVARDAELRALRGTTIAGTRPAALAAVGAAGPVTLMLADGLSIAGGAVAASGNRFDGNARFGAVFFRARGELTANRGEGNRYGIRAWDSTVRGVDESAVHGREPAPADPIPVAAGASP